MSLDYAKMNEQTPVYLDHLVPNCSLNLNFTNHMYLDILQSTNISTSNFSSYMYHESLSNSLTVSLNCNDVNNMHLYNTSWVDNVTAPKVNTSHCSFLSHNYLYVNLHDNVNKHNVVESFLPDSILEPVIQLSSNVNNNNDVNLFLPGTTLEPVINLSSFQLTPAMISLLSKGLTFCPTPLAAERYDLRKDLDKFHTSLRRKQFFDKGPLSTTNLASTSGTTDIILPDTDSDNEDEPFDHFKFRSPSTWSPFGPFHLESYITLNEFALNKCTLTAPAHPNLNKTERQALAELERAHHIVIKKADKGSAVVIQNRDDYIDEGLRQLSNPNFYVETRDDLTHLHNELITNLIRHMHDNLEISDKCCSYLTNNSPRTPQLYLLPKIHKNQKPVPGRPIVSANNSPTERISQLADFFLQPLVHTTKSYVKDTTDFINKIEALAPLSPDSLLCTVDVCSLYTNIPNDEGILACKNILNHLRTTTQAPSNQNIIRLLTHVLYMNNFDFNDKHYLQVGGTAMGTKVAPSFANIFMADFEDTFVYNYHTQPLIWLRYIDDIFMIWDKGSDSLQEFLSHLNSCHNTIKFTSEISSEKVNFLDTTVLIDTDRKLYTNLYCKPTDSHNYLLYDSAHPSHLKKSLPFSQLLRIRRICSKLDDFDKNAILIGSHFLRRNYPPTQVEDAIIEVRRTSRESLLHPPVKPPKEDFFSDLFLVSTFNPDATPLRDIVTENWPLLGRTNNTESLFSKRIIFGYRRNKNLSDLLVHAKLAKPPTDDRTLRQRSYKRRCLAKNCRYCPKLDKTGKILCTTTGKEYHSKHNITCNSNNLIYCITCKHCSGQYVGQTKNAIKERFKCHFYSITQPDKSNTAVGRHFSATDHNGLSNVTIHVLEFILSPSESPASQRTRDDLERTWIHRLVSTAPHGINVAD